MATPRGRDCDRDRDRELLIPVGSKTLELEDGASISSSSPTISTPSPSSLHLRHPPTGIETFSMVIRSWASKKFMTGCLGEWFIKKMPLVRLIYSASKQISVAISPDQSSQAFKEAVIIRHPRVGEYAIGFITSTVSLHRSTGDEELSCVYVPTNHLYLGDIFLISSKDIIRPNLSVREGIEIVISGGMSIPKILSTVESKTTL
ncbi:hypothetical protein COCNU_05G001310 [Cocos nucifera]|uniref:Uncharacterized protein n=1 Tax=Cocos nucifera TaxID=13894 RepID=A0A8K0I7M8_COCNU|nr:hypothetical protein COCNU_05G001310 [Cocos nucifera]